MAKTKAQLDRDIAEALAKKKSNTSSAPSKSDYDWESFTAGAAFALWASPYISEVENLADESREAYKALSPGPGGNWENVIPKPPPSARALAKKFAKAVREKLTAAELSEIFDKFSARDAGHYGAMQSQGEGVGWFDEGVRADPPRGFQWDPNIQNDVWKAIRSEARKAGVKLPR